LLMTVKLKRNLKCVLVKKKMKMRKVMNYKKKTEIS